MDTIALLRRAREAGLCIKPAGDKLLVHGPKHAEPVVRILARHKAEVLAALADSAREAELSPQFARCLSPDEGQPSLDMPCASRRGRVEARPDGLILHFCAECGAWGAFGYGVNLCAGRLGRWCCAAHRPQSAAQ